MKKIFYIIVFSLVFFYTQSVSAIVCDQTFEGTVLRYDRGYKFYDTWHNGTSKDTFINTRSIRFIDAGNSNELMTSSYLDPGSAFDWTSELKNSKFKVAAGTSMRIIETGATNWRISKTPTNRTNATKNNHDFMIYYKVAYDQSNNYPNSSDDVSHVECKYYSVSWCGDGVKDDGYEVCDPKDPNKSGWGNGGCNVNTCEPINVNPPATCDSISVTPNTGLASLGVDISCSGTNALNYTIQCGNGATINSKTGKCTYAIVGDYHPSCTVNNTITSDSCKSKVVVKAPTPAIQVEKYSGNPNDLDGNKNHNQADDSQTVNISDKAIFTIEVNNVGNEDLSNVYLTDAISPNCDRNDAQVKTILKTIGNLDEVFNIGETFKYTCEKLDTKSDYVNRINVNAIGINSKIPVSDTDDTQIKIISPSILLVKTDINPNDIDGVIGNDTQTVNFGSGAIFKITVTNNGTEDLNNIAISDTLAPNCSGNLTLPGTKPATWLNFTIYGSGNNSDNIFQVGESFSYNCEKSNTQTNYTNTASVNGKGVTSLKDVNDDDTSEVIVTNLTTPLCTNLTATPLTGVNSLTSTLTCTGSNVTKYRIDCGNGQTINSNTGTCNYTTIGTYTPTCFVNGTITSPSCKKEVIVTEAPLTYDLALKKTLSGTKTTGFKVGDEVIFNITVYNQGNIDANDVRVVDYIPLGLTLNDNNWTLDNNKAFYKNNVGPILPGSNKVISIKFTINSQATGKIVNWAEISSDDGDDCDSTPDSNQSNDNYMTDDYIGDGCNIGGDEDDHDQAEITIGNDTTPLCTNLTATPLTGVNSLTSTLTCTGSNVTKYRIDCGNGQTINSNTGTCNYTAIGTYIPKCFVNDTITSQSCQQTITVTNSTSSSSSSSSGGGTQYQCRDISMTGNQVTCTGNHLVKTFRLSCNGADLFAPANSSTGNITTATFTCNDNRATCSVYNQTVTESSYYSWLTNPACKLTPSSSSSSSSSGGSSSSSGGSSSSSSGGSSPNYCGDGVVQRPNDRYEDEECDFGTGTWPKWCGKPDSGNKACKVDGTESFPNDGQIVFGPKDFVIVGNSMNPYTTYSLPKPSILNNSLYDLYFDSLCVATKSGTTLNGTTFCQPINKTLFPGTSFSLSSYPNFVGNTSSLGAGTYGDNILVTTIEHDGELYKNAYFASELKVRVSKPSIATTGGGTSYVGNTKNISNVSEVSKATGNQDKNKNFVGAGVSTGSISSYSSTVGDNDSVKDISNIGENYNNQSQNISTTTAIRGDTIILSDFKSYNGINNAFVLRNKNFEVSSGIFSGLTGARTYIIENGDLIINEDINYPNNIAFVVKGGNIKIDKTVKNITGTFISIPIGSNGGDIVGIGGNTNEVLNLRGSFYGNLEDLVSKRTYIKEEAGLLTVGTIVSFGSSVFRDPAPLTSTFINEYLNATKVAK